LDSAIDDVDIQEMIEEEGDDEESLFVPLSWPKPMPRQYYHQSDKDWQEFIKFSNNPEKKKAIRGRFMAGYRQIEGILTECIRRISQPCSQRYISKCQNTADIRQEDKTEQALA